MKGISFSTQEVKIDAIRTIKQIVEGCEGETKEVAERVLADIKAAEVK